jgi:ParB family chromosome partitioning protein
MNSVGGKEIMELPLDCLVIGHAQVRLRDVEAELDELTESIRIHGLLEPIIVMRSVQAGKYDIVSGQRRYLAHRRLGREAILAVVMEEVDLLAAKILSLTENVVRKDLDAKDMVDVCTALFRKYGTAVAVAEETGIPYPKVLKYVKYERLTGSLRDHFDAGHISLEAALAAQDIATDPYTKQVDEVLAMKAAEEMSPLSRIEVGQLRRRFHARRNRHSDTDILGEISNFVTARSEPHKHVDPTIPLVLSSKDAAALAELAGRKGLSSSELAQQLVVAGLNTTFLRTQQSTNGSTNGSTKRRRGTPVGVRRRP